MAPQAFPTTAPERRTPALVAVDGRAYPLRSAELRGRAEGGLAASRLIQEFQNPHDEPLEVIYSMPLPADGAVLGYTIHVGERVIRGEIERREKAEAAYRKALYEGKTAGLLEEDRADTFQQRLGNVPPRTDVRVEIEVLQPLLFLAGTEGARPLWEYRFPTVVGPRYQGKPGRVPDAERLDLDRAVPDEEGGIPTRIGLALTVADRIEGAGCVTSASHAVRETVLSDRTIVSLGEGARLDRDLVLQWAAATGDVGVRLTEGKGLPGDEGRYALLTITPPCLPARAFRRDLTILLDSSGSMTGAPIEIAKRVAADLLQSLGSGDRFEVWEFSDRPKKLSRGVEEATASSIEQCIRKIQAITAGGGTEMLAAVEEAMKPLRRDSQRQVILVTDGEIGFEAELLERMSERLPAGVRAHVVGVGSSPNRTLTRGVARAGRGIELFASSEETAGEAARRLRAATVRPILTDLTISGSALVGAAPAKPRDVFAGQPLVMAVELSPEGGTLEVAGNFAGSLELWIWRMEVPALKEGATAKEAAAACAAERALAPLPLGALYGRERIADLEIGLAGTRGPSTEIDRAIEAVALRHRIVSRRTSLVAIAEEPAVDPRGPRRRERLAVELPAGVSAEAVGLERGIPTGLLRMSLGETASLEAMKSYPLARGIGDVIGGAFRGVLRREAAPEETIPAGVATLLVVEGKEATLEIETPFEEFFLPRGLVAVLFAERRLIARVVESKSGPRGPHEKGILVRLVLELLTPRGWSGTPLELRWSVPPAVSHRADRNITLSFSVQDARGSMDAT